MNNENYEKYAVLRRPLESGRQSPMNLSGILVLGAFLQAGLYALEYYVVGYSSVHPYKEEILRWHFWISAVLIILGLIFAIPFVYRRFEKLQYLISILYSQNLFTASSYLLALFAITETDFGSSTGERMTFSGFLSMRDSMMTFTYMTLLAGLLVFLLTLARMIWKIRRGDYREGSSSDQLRSRFEYKSYLPAATVAGLGLFFVIQYVFRHIGFDDPNRLIIIFIGFAVFYTMIFVLPEQLVILYLKFRFRSFNFNSGNPPDAEMYTERTERF